MCPNSHENLKIENSEVRSTDNKYCYKIEDGIYRFLNEIKSSETENVKKFYMEDPFPNYNSFDNLETFIEKMKNNSFINSISKILKPGDRVLEFGLSHSKVLQRLSKGLKDSADPDSSDSNDIDKYVKYIFHIKVDTKNIAWDVLHRNFSTSYHLLLSIQPHQNLF